MPQRGKGPGSEGSREPFGGSEPAPALDGWKSLCSVVSSEPKLSPTAAEPALPTPSTLPDPESPPGGGGLAGEAGRLQVDLTRERRRKALFAPSACGAERLFF